MPCPHGGTSESTGASRSRGDGVSRRDFVRVAVSIGGASALSACIERGDIGTGDDRTETDDGAGLPDLPAGDPEAVPDRQHAWTASLLTDEHGNPKFPEYQSFLFLNYDREGVPTDADRETVESAFRSLEKAYVWGTDEGADRKFFHDGIFFTVAYSPSYFSRFDADVPGSVDLRPPAAVHEAVGEDPARADGHDAVVHLATDYPGVLLATELALFGERTELNGVEMESHLGDVFARADRRAGFVGHGLPAENLDEERVSEEAPASMGFKSALRDNTPSEDRVTLRDGPFAGGTTMHVSQLAIDLGSWYDRDLSERVDRMYSPHHTVEEVGEAGKNVAADSGVTEAIADSTAEDAEGYGVVGHAQKIARARDDDFDPRLLRRGDFNSARPGGSTLHFGSLHRSTGDLIETLRAMYDVGFGGDPPDIDPEDDGILSVLETRSRATFLMPPRNLRALPPARPD